MEKGKQEENDEVIDVLGEHQPRMGCVYESLHWIEKRMWRLDSVMPILGNVGRKWM